MCWDISTSIAEGEVIVGIGRIVSVVIETGKVDERRWSPYTSTLNDVQLRLP